MTFLPPMIDASRHLYSPIGLRLLDELTHEAPLGNTAAFLDIRTATGAWQLTDIKAVGTPSGVIAYPGLERHADPVGLPPQHYRVRISADFYVPLYQSNSDGIEFDASAWNDDHPPLAISALAQDTFLTPAPNYPFPDHIPVLRGVVQDAAGKPVANAVVTQGALERVVTDSRGTFALPLRWVQQHVATPIDAVDNRTGRVGTINVQLPNDLAVNQKIQIS